MPSTGRFTHKNDGFSCLSCGREVPPRRVGCRNHCPYCLTSRHVDLLPGDRANPCQGLMRAVGYEMSGKKGIILRFRCDTCGAITRNVAAYDGEDTPDDYDQILKLISRRP